RTPPAPVPMPRSFARQPHWSLTCHDAMHPGNSMASKLEQLKAMTLVVADTGNMQAIKKYQPVDATTNPSLLLKAAALPEYADQITRSLQDAIGQGEARLADACERLA